MSNVLSALPGAASDGVVSVSEAGPVGMVTLKADLNAAKAAGKAATGQTMPGLRQINGNVAWMAHDELLILTDHGAADATVATLTDKLKGKHFLAANVSDARAVFDLKGAAVKDVLGKLTPADLAALQPGEMRRTRLAQVAAAIWLEADDHARVVCFRSVAQYVFDLLTTAALPGSEVKYHTP